MRFVVEVHEDYGNFGLRPIGMPNADPLPGMAVAHDVLEHFPKDDGGIECEIQALGAAYFVRGEGGYFQQGVGNPDPLSNIAADFPELHRHFEHEGFTLDSPGRTQSIEYADDELRAIANKACRDIVENCDTRKPFDLPFYLAKDVIHGWLRKGYRRAVRRYKDTSPCELTHLFIQIEKEVDAKLGTEWEHEGIVINIHVKNGRFFIREESWE